MHELIPQSGLYKKCHFDERSEEKSPHSFQKEISHFVRNDNPELIGHPLSVEILEMT